jgi:peroxiredoxin Q/BCP
MASNLREGQPAPDFELATDGGGRVRLSDLRGSPAVVYFYPKDDTPGCTIEAGEFTRQKAEFDAIGARVIGISADSVADHERFKEKYDLEVTLAADENRQAIDLYGVWVEKNRDGRTFMGIERATYLIDADGRIARVWREVAAPGHAAEVLEAARGL